MKAILSFFLISSIVFFLLHLSGKQYVVHQASRGEWIESTVSKFELLKSKGPKKYVFVGSSTTHNQFDTLIMEEEGLSFFNFGLPGLHWKDYHFLLSDLASSPLSETIVLNLSPMLLVSKLECPELDEVRKLLVLRDWNCLQSFNPLKMLPFSREFPFLRVGISNPEAFRKILNVPGVRGPSESRIHFLRGQGLRHVFALKEGDGLIVSPDEIRFPRTEKEDLFFELPAKNIEHLSSLVSLVQKHSRNLVIIIEPRWPIYTPSFSLVPLPGVKIIPNHELYIHERWWVDHIHLNRDGVKLYSRLVACQLKGMHDCKPLKDKLLKGL